MGSYSTAAAVGSISYPRTGWRFKMSKNVHTLRGAGVQKCPQADSPIFPTQSLCDVVLPNMPLSFPLTPMLDKWSLYLIYKNDLGVNSHSKLQRIIRQWKTHSLCEPSASTSKNCKKLNHITSRLKCFHHNHTLQDVCYLVYRSLWCKLSTELFICVQSFSQYMPFRLKHFWLIQYTIIMNWIINLCLGLIRINQSATYTCQVLIFLQQLISNHIMQIKH